MEEPKLRLPEGCGYKARSLVADDAEAVYALTRLPVGQGTPDPSFYGGIQQLLSASEERLVTDSKAVFCDGQLVAAVLLLLSPVPQDEQVVSFLGAIHPDQCNRGLELSLSEWVDSRVRMAQNANGNPRRIRASCDPAQRSCVALLEGLGFEPVRYFHRMCVTLQESVHEPTLPSQVRLDSWDSSCSSQALEAFNNAFTGHWGLPLLTQAMWDKAFVGVPQFRPDLSLLAMSGSDVIGVCINWVLPITEGSRHPQGWIEAIGVISEWRGRGVADAMMVRTLNEFLKDKRSEASLAVDTQNLSGALRLYEKHGFVPIKQTTMFERLLD
jgi:GNAT superfamily N-acetyltransferase